MDAWPFYNLKEPVKPTVYEFADAQAYLRHLDGLGVERGLVLPNYGIPVQGQPFSLNGLVLDSIQSSDRLVGGIWVSFLPQNKEMTLAALKLAGEPGVVALKTTFLLGGNPDPAPGTTTPVRSPRPVRRRRGARPGLSLPHQRRRYLRHQQLHPDRQKYGKRMKIYLVHFGGGVSGHIKLVPHSSIGSSKDSGSIATPRGQSVSALGG